MEQCDRDILDWVAAHTGNPELTAQIDQAVVKRRDHTRTGVFVYFVPGAAAEVPDGVRPVCPRINAPGLPDGAGCDLFLRNGRLHYLEIYARGGFLPDPLEGYQLRPEAG